MLPNFTKSNMALFIPRRAIFALRPVTKKSWLNLLFYLPVPTSIAPSRILSTTSPSNGIFSRFVSPKPRKPRFRLGVLTGTGGVLLLMWASRRYRESLTMDINTPVHPDKSCVAISSAKNQVIPTVKIVTHDQSSTIVDQEKYTAFVRASVASLSNAEKEMQKEASELLAKRLTECFKPVRGRAEQFADWYFAYSTTFKLLQEATMSLARHSMKFMEATPVNEAVSGDLDSFITKKYERIVLRPEINNAELQSAYLQCVKNIHAKFAEAVRNVEDGMVDLLATNTSHLQPPRAADIQLNLDWASQLHKIKTIPANFEKNPELTLLLSSGGALVGKTMAGKSVGMASAKAMAGSSTKVLAGKLSAPFVTKAMAAASGALAGTLAGPFGTIMGATIGIGIDYTVNAGIELVNRDEFIRDVDLVVDATQKDYFNLLETELHRATKVWIEDAIQLLPKFGLDKNDIVKVNAGKELLRGMLIEVKSTVSRIIEVLETI